MLSGAYAVLRGAPAVVTAVDRYVVANGKHPAGLETPEVVAALQALAKRGIRLPPGRSVPSFDASALRSDGRKLGLGSSAAIVVASLWEIISHLEELKDHSPSNLRELVFELALSGHRAAQGGGSGIDVAAATFGGTLVAKKADDRLFLEATPLPPELHFETWAMPSSASTARFIRAVLSLESSAPHRFTETFGSQTRASLQAADALRKEDTGEFLFALTQQCHYLAALGDAAEVPIVTPQVRSLWQDVDPQACFLPSGAGGGDVTLYIGRRPSSPTFRRRAGEAGLQLVDLRLGAEGSGPSPDPGP